MLIIYYREVILINDKIENSNCSLPTEVDMVLMSNKTKSSRPLLFVKVQIQRDEKSGEKSFSVLPFCVLLSLLKYSWPNAS